MVGGDTGGKGEQPGRQEVAVTQSVANTLLFKPDLSDSKARPFLEAGLRHSRSLASTDFPQAAVPGHMAAWREPSHPGFCV